MEKMKEIVKTDVEPSSQEILHEGLNEEKPEDLKICIQEKAQVITEPTTVTQTITPFNTISNALIENVFLAASRHPGFAGCVILRDSETYKDMGAVGIKMLRKNVPLNLFLFFPAPDGSGEIGSVAIYGIQLSEHKRAIEETMTLFGLPVETVRWDRGKEPYVDVTIKSYQ